MSRLLVSMFTDRGAVRDHNEDRLAFRQFRHPTGNYELLAVADGMGGHARGEVAAQLALQAIEEFLGFGAWTDPGEALERAFQLANQRVHDEGGGMGTTLVALLVDVQTLQTWVANVGDSRAYVLRPTGPEALTRDHSEVAARVEAGLLTREEAESVDGRNVLLRAIGPDPEVEVDVSPPFELREGERLLLCSDGLHGMLPERQFLEMAASASLGSEPARLLAEAAIAAGGRDNVTVILAAPATEETVRMGSFPAPGRIRRKRKVPLQTVAGGIAVLVLVLTGAGVAFALAGGSDPTPPAVDETPTSQVPSPTAGTTAPPSPTPTSVVTSTPTATPSPSATPTATPVSPTATPVPPTATPVPPTATPVPPTANTGPPTATPVSPTATPVPPTATDTPTATATATSTATATATSPAGSREIEDFTVETNRQGNLLKFKASWRSVQQVTLYEVFWRDSDNKTDSLKVAATIVVHEVTGPPGICFWVTVAQNPSQRSDEDCEP